MGQLTGSITQNGIGFVKANIDGISFNKINSGGSLSKDPKIRSRENSVNYVWKNGVTSLDQWAGVINAVDIDWNEAELGNINGKNYGNIKTTADLINIIKYLLTLVNNYNYYIGEVSYDDLDKISTYNINVPFNRTGVKPETIIAAGKYNIFVWPASWGTPTFYTDPDHTSQFDPFSEDELGFVLPKGNNLVCSFDYTKGSIIYLSWENKNDDNINDNDVTTPTYDYYIGEVSYDDLDKTSTYNINVPFNRTGVKPETIIAAGRYNVLVWPASWGTPTLYTDPDHTSQFDPYSEDDIGFELPKGDNLICSFDYAKNSTIYITWPN